MFYFLGHLVSSYSFTHLKIQTLRLYLVGGVKWDEKKSGEKEKQVEDPSWDSLLCISLDRLQFSLVFSSDLRVKKMNSIGKSQTPTNPPPPPPPPPAPPRPF
jgi:hypothetical protein